MKNKILITGILALFIITTSSATYYEGLFITQTYNGVESSRANISIIGEVKSIEIMLVNATSGEILTGQQNFTLKIYDANESGNLVWEQDHIGYVIEENGTRVFLRNLNATNSIALEARNITCASGTDCLDRTQINESNLNVNSSNYVTCGGIENTTSDLCTLTDTNTNTFNSSDEMRRAVNGTDGLLWYNFTVNRSDNVLCSGIENATSDLCTLTDSAGGNSTLEMIAAVNQTYNYTISVYSADFWDLLNTPPAIWYKGNSSAEIIASMNVSGYSLNISVDFSRESDCSGIHNATSDLCTLADTNTFNGTDEMRLAINGTDGLLEYNITTNKSNTAADLICSNCIGGNEIAELTDADISDTLTASDLVAGSSVVADAEVDDDITLNTTSDILVNNNANITASSGNIDSIGNITLHAAGNTLQIFWNSSASAWVIKG